MSAAGPPQGTRPPGGAERSDARGDQPGAAGPPRAIGWIESLLARGAIVEAPAGPGNNPSRVVRFAGTGDAPAASAGQPVICPLLDWTAVSIAGTDAQAFLQGQFTNDVVELAEGSVQLSGYCSPKGRLLANFALAAVAGNEYVLVVPADVAAGFVSRLRMFVMRAKVVIAGLESPVIGLHGSAAADTPAGRVRRRDGITTIGLPDGRVLAVCAPERAATFWDDMARTSTPAGTPTWDALAIRAGVPVVTAATADKFVPQMLNWELLGGVSFRKGCYTGQEIVARMQYLGRLKERLYRAHTSATGIPAGAPLFGRKFGDQSCGTIVNAAPSATSGTDVLAVLQVASAVQDAIRLGPGHDSAELALSPLPYPVPAAERGAMA